MNFIQQNRHILIPVAIGAVGGSLAGYFAASFPALVGLGVGIALTVVAFRRKTLVG